MSQQDQQAPDDQPARPEGKPQRPERLIDRRTLIKGGLLAGGALAGGGAALADLIAKQDPTSTIARASRHGRARHAGSKGSASAQTPTKKPGSGERHRPPNILVIMVDQLRTPQWFSAAPEAAALMPNLARLRNGGVSFASHYTAANDCTPARAALLTGLHTHQTA